MSVAISVEAVPGAVRAICARLEQAGHEAFVVGGCVRDAILGRAAHDWDVTTSASPAQVKRLFARVIPTGERHGTVTVLQGGGGDGEGMAVEVTTYRADADFAGAQAGDAARFGKTLDEDLARRDFTINAIALHPTSGKLVDPHGGQADLGRRQVRAVGSAAERFAEDALRVMRALRFSATLGFTVEEETLRAIPGALGRLADVAVERVRDELLKTLGAAAPSTALEAARATGVLGAVLPELLEGVGCAQNRHHRFDVWRHTLTAVDATHGDAVCRLGALLHDVGKPATRAAYEDRPGEFSFHKHELVGAEMAEGITERLKLSHAERKRVVGMVAHHMFSYEPGQRDASVRRFIQRAGLELIPDLLLLRAGDVVGKGFGEDAEARVTPLREAVARVLAEKSALSVKDLEIDGADVMQALALAPGRRVGEVLTALLERVVDDPQLNSREVLLALLPAVANTDGSC